MTASGIGIGIGIPFGGSALSAEAALVAQLFGSGEDGAFFAPWDTASMGQSRTASGAAAYADTDGDVVGLMLDKSQITPGLTIPEWANQQTSLFDLGTSTFAVGTSGGSDGSYTPETGVMEVTSVGMSGSYPRYGASLLTLGRWYYLKAVFSGDVSQIVDMGGNLSANRISSYTGTTTRTYEGFFAPTDTAFVITTDGRTAYSITIDSLQIVEVPGLHAVAPSDAARPQLDITSDVYSLVDDAVDDVLSVTLPDLGTDATEVVVTTSGVTINEGLTIGAGARDVLTNNLVMYIALDRAVTTAEEAAITALGNEKRGA